MKKKYLKRLEEVGLEGITIRINAQREVSYINESFEEWEKYLDYEQKYTRNVFGVIIGYKDYEETEIIGKFKGTFFETESQIKETNFWDVCDSMNGDLEYMASRIVDDEMKIKETICTMNNNIFYLDEIFIDEKYRSYGIGKFVLKQLDKFIMHTSNLDVGVVITYPYAMEGTVKRGYKGIEDKEKKEETLKRLRKFYRSCGFKKVGKSHMYKKYGDTFEYYK